MRFWDFCFRVRCTYFLTGLLVCCSAFLALSPRAVGLYLFSGGRGVHGVRVREMGRYQCVEGFSGHFKRWGVGFPLFLVVSRVSLSFGMSLSVLRLWHYASVEF